MHSGDQCNPIIFHIDQISDEQCNRVIFSIESNSDMHIYQISKKKALTQSVLLKIMQLLQIYANIKTKKSRVCLLEIFLSLASA